VDFAQDFFGREAFLTVSGQAQCRGLLPGADQGLYLRADLPRQELEHQPPSRRVLDVEPETAFVDLSDNAALAEALLKYTSRRC
jgi:asparaginyl-tRNA synthetase